MPWPPLLIGSLSVLRQALRIWSFDAFVMSWLPRSGSRRQSYRHAGLKNAASLQEPASTSSRITVEMRRQCSLPAALTICQVEFLHETLRKRFADCLRVQDPRQQLHAIN